MLYLCCAVALHTCISALLYLWHPGTIGSMFSCTSLILNLCYVASLMCCSYAYLHVWSPVSHSHLCYGPAMAVLYLFCPVAYHTCICVLLHLYYYDSIIYDISAFLSWPVSFFSCIYGLLYLCYSVSLDKD